MHKVTYKSLLMSISILSLAVLAGWLFVEKLINKKSGMEFVSVGLIVSGSLFIMQFGIFNKAKKLLFYQLLFMAVFGLDLAWFLTCFFLPLLWLPSASFALKLIMICVFIFVCISNILLATRTLEKKWEKAGIMAFEEKYREDKKSIMWGEVFDSMKISSTIYIPGVSRKHDQILSFVLFVFLIGGVILRSINPVYSMVALGIPLSVCAACCLQMSAYRVAEARKVRMLELSKNIKIRSSE